MTAYFFDSSAAAKLYVFEKGSSWVTDLVDPTQRHELLTVRIVELNAAARAEGLDVDNPNDQR